MRIQTNANRLKAHSRPWERVSVGGAILLSFTITFHKCGLTQHDFRRTTDQIGCDMSRRVIAGNRGKWLTSGPLRFTISHYTTDFPRLRIISQFTAMSQIFWTCSKCYDGLRYPPIVRIAADRIAEGLTLNDVLSATASWGAIAGHRKLKIV